MPVPGLTIKIPKALPNKKPMEPSSPNAYSPVYEVATPKIPYGDELNINTKLYFKNTSVKPLKLGYHNINTPRNYKNKNIRANKNTNKNVSMLNMTRKNNKYLEKMNTNNSMNGNMSTDKNMNINSNANTSEYKVESPETIDNSAFSLKRLASWLSLGGKQRTRKRRNHKRKNTRKNRRHILRK